MATRLAINGAAGRMGRRLVALGNADPDLEIVAALESPNCPQLGEDAGTVAGIGPINVPISAGLDVDVDAVIDFSLPVGTEAALAVCLEKKLPLIVATTALSDEQLAKLNETSKIIPLLFAPNMSLAVNLGMKLVEVAGEALKNQDADVEIIERHHRFKEDSPSGTALKFGQIVAERMGQTQHQHGREGRPGARPHNEIGYHAVRVGDNPGEHTIVFGLLGETVEVTVRASNRDCYAIGALAAAKFLVGKPVGMYSMKDVLAF
ncbi:MAG: 4-hydroxy-tetrahydrodipicolinate reductase [Planctomycetia bacterium]|jgi:4-hydroxy-tetrahydrodipicolinate reductase